LNAPSGSGGKLVVGQAPNITITETTVVADAAERLALDVQEGDVAVQTNVSTSFIFTGGDNVANNWQALDFDAVGAIAGEAINPSEISGANIDTAGSGQLLQSDGSGNLQFGAPAGGVPTGGIIMWSGAIGNIPSGFVLCDGTNGTPDLTDRFVLGAGGSESIGDTGGADTQNVNVSVSGTTEQAKFTLPTVTLQDSHTGPGAKMGQTTLGRGISYEDADLTDRIRGIQRSNGSGPQDVLPLRADFSASGSDSFDNRPPYYALAYIMKT